MEPARPAMGLFGLFCYNVGQTVERLKTIGKCNDVLFFSNLINLKVGIFAADADYRFHVIVINRYGSRCFPL